MDAGDHIQGTAYGSMDDGATIIELMNEAGYDIATLGNHEFDYGMARAKAIIKEADFPYVSCNWVDLRTGLRVLPAVKLFPAGGKWIAFVAVSYTHLDVYKRQAEKLLVRRFLPGRKATMDHRGDAGRPDRAGGVQRSRLCPPVRRTGRRGVNGFAFLLAFLAEVCYYILVFVCLLSKFNNKRSVFIHGSH